MSSFATITEIETGEIVQQLGPFDSANLARLACGQVSGELLRWEIAGLNWEARTETQVFQVQREWVPEAEE